MPQGEAAAGLRDAAERCCQACRRHAPPPPLKNKGRAAHPGGATLPQGLFAEAGRRVVRSSLLEPAEAGRRDVRSSLLEPRSAGSSLCLMGLLRASPARVAQRRCVSLYPSGQRATTADCALPGGSESGGASHRGCDMACSRLANTVVGFITPACQCPSQCAPRHIARGALLRAFKLRGGAVPLLRRRCMWLLRQVTSSHEQAWGTPARARGTPCHMQPQRSCTDAIGARRRIPNHAAGRTVVKGARLPKPALVHELACCRHRCPAAPMQPLSFPWCCHENGGTAPCTCTWPSCGGRST